jgi:plastocyanin
MKTRWIYPLMILALVFSALAIACSGDDTNDDDDDSTSDADDDFRGDDDIAPGGNNVTIEDFSMNPDPITVKLGSTVTWTNMDIAPHTVTSGDPDGVIGLVFDSPVLSFGDTFSYTFEGVGSVPYFCRSHPDLMKGYLVNVEL